MQKELNKEAALNRTMALCSKMEKCRFDIQQKLNLWKIPANEQNEIIEKLEDLNFINEERFVNSFIKQKFEINKWGKIKIKYLLSQKKINQKLLEAKLNEINNIQYYETLFHKLEKKNKKIKTENKLERKAKLIKFATSHGFEYDIIITEINKLINY